MLYALVKLYTICMLGYELMNATLIVKLTVCKNCKVLLYEIILLSVVVSIGSDLTLLLLTLVILALCIMFLLLFDKPYISLLFRAQSIVFSDWVVINCCL